MAYVKKETGKVSATADDKAILKEYLKREDFVGYMDAQEVKGKTLKQIWTLSKQTGKFHISIVRKLASLFGVPAYKAKISDMNSGLEKVALTIK